MPSDSDAVYGMMGFLLFCPCFLVLMGVMFFAEWVEGRVLDYLDRRRKNKEEE